MTLKAVETLYVTNAREIPEMLRKLATEVERNSDINCAVCVIFDSKTGRYNCYGWGDTDIDKSITFLGIAQKGLQNVRDGGRLWDIPVGGAK